MLKQTLQPTLIYVVIPDKWKRFGSLSDEELRKLRDYHPKVKLIKYNLDSPLIKHIGAFKHEIEIDRETIQFVGDDDQAYHHTLLERMYMTMIDRNAVYQNRYNQVVKGSGGTIHGFVGLMYKTILLKYFFTGEFKYPNECWVDDQLMSIYFWKYNISIKPTPIESYDNIYAILSHEGRHENFGGNEALHKYGNRDEQVRQLERFYGVKFIDKLSMRGKGVIKYAN